MKALRNKRGAFTLYRAPVLYLFLMDKSPNRTNIFKSRLITIVVLAIIWFLLMLLADYPVAVERYYSNGFYPVLCHIFHPLFNLFPFSFGDVLYITVVIYIIYAVYKLIKLCLKRQFKLLARFIIGIIIGVQSAVLIFYIFWGMNYFRMPAGERLGLRDTGYTTADLKAVATLLIDSANATRARLSATDLNQGNGAIYKASVAAINKLSADSADFRTYAPRVKSSLLTFLMNYMGTSGYYNPFTTEAQMNSEMPAFDRPVTACHELSHQMGYGGEDEANFVGFLAGIGSHDRLLRYSAYHLAVDECMHALYFRDSLENKALKPRVSALVHQDFVAERTYWRSYQSKIDVISSLFYDKFLKANNQPQGLGTYNRMVLLVMAMYRNKVHGEINFSVYR